MDQSVFESACEQETPHARFYHWNEPAVTVGYFHQFSDHELTSPRPVRRFTGGGTVEHGSDATFVLALPAGSSLASFSSDDRYRWVHTALAAALNSANVPVELEATPTPSGVGPCFTTPVTWDLLSTETGEKIGGGAQRRSSGAIMHQGSVRLPANIRTPDSDWILDFLQNLSENLTSLSMEQTAELEKSATRLDTEKFSNESWNRWQN